MYKIIYHFDDQQLKCNVPFLPRVGDKITIEGLNVYGQKVDSVSFKHGSLGSFLGIDVRLVSRED